MKAAAIFLDRDGVLNRGFVRNGKSYPPDRLDEVEVFSGIAAQLRGLKERGFLLIVVTNQPDVARGKTSKETVQAINLRIAEEIGCIDDFKVCFHDDSDNCTCRKPKPGMILAAAEEFDIDLGRSYMVGDRRSDVEAGSAAGARTIFIDYGYAEPPPVDYTYRVLSTQEALRIIEANA